jgi:hypothetical protein
MPIRTLVILVLAAAALGGCGRRGSLEAPGTVATDGTAPAPLSDGISPLDPGAPAPASHAAPTGQLPAPPAQPKRRFFLDFLL